MDNRKVVVTTIHRGVFFGTLVSQDGDKCLLAKARNCVYWDSVTHGFLGLAKVGPNKNCRVGPAVDQLELFGVTSISDCTPEASAAWEAEPWN